jgi:dynein heavy chain
LVEKDNEDIYSCVVPGDFMKEGEVYEDLSDFAALKKYMEDQLEDYNMEPGVIPMNLVLFRDAIEHG